MHYMSIYTYTRQTHSFKKGNDIWDFVCCLKLYVNSFVNLLTKTENRLRHYDTSKIINFWCIR